MNRLQTVTMSTIMLSGCALSPATAEVGGDPAIMKTESRLAAPQRALDHGALLFGTSVEAALTAGEPLHAWTFELSAPATLTLTTRGTATGPDVDTVLHLYRAGTQPLLASSDDHDDTVFSSLSSELSAGSYRVEVGSRTTRDVGPFALSSTCSAGCPTPVQHQACVFGERVADIAGNLRMSTILSVRSAEQLPAEDGHAQLLVSAAHTPAASAHTPEQVFASVDESLVRWWKIWDDAGGREYTAYEYNISGGSFGAIFDADSGELMARIDESEISECRVPLRTCVFGPSFSLLQPDTRFEVLAQNKVTEQSLSDFSRLERAQLLAAVCVAYPEAKNTAQALASVDSQQVNQLVLEERATTRTVTIYEYSAGDNSYGAAFLQNGRVMQARIEDGQITACTLYAPD